MLRDRPTLFALVLVQSKVLAALCLSLLAFDLKIDAPTATVIVAGFVAISSMWQSYMLTKVHTLVNSNFSEAKAARFAAEAALVTSTALNASLQQQLDRQGARRAGESPPVPVVIVPSGGPGPGSGSGGV